MKLAFSSNAYLRFSIEETIKRIANLGYQGIELLADVPHAWPAGLLEEQKQTIRDSLAKNNLAISNINAFMMNAVADPRQPYWHPSWIEPDPHYRAIRREHTKRTLHLARELGGTAHHDRAGRTRRERPNVASGGRDLLRRADAVCRSCRTARRADSHRTGARTIDRTIRAIFGIFGRIDSPMIGLNFDIGHAYCVSEDPQDWVARMAEHTRHYHFEDIAATRIHQHLVPGRGAIDFAATLAAIQTTGYTGWLTIELYPYIDDPDAAAKEAKNFIVTELNKLASK